MKRLFFALWPDQKTRSEIDRLNQTIKLDTIRHLKPENLHVTLLFLGNVSDEIAALVQQRAQHIKAQPFSFYFDGIDFWQRPRVLCLTASQQPPELYDLVTQLTDMVADLPLSLIDRPYRAHITLARKAKTSYALEYEPVKWQAEEFVLVESRSDKQGVHYDVLARWPLTVT